MKLKKVTVKRHLRKVRKSILKEIQDTLNRVVARCE